MPGNILTQFFSHLANAGSFNEGRTGQVSGDDLPPEVKRRVDQLAAQRDVMARLEGEENQKQAAALQDSINYLYNPRTRDQAMASWAALHGDEDNRWSATGGHLGTAAGMVNEMTTNPDSYHYGGRRAGSNIPRGARVARD